MYMNPLLWKCLVTRVALSIAIRFLCSVLVAVEQDGLVELLTIQVLVNLQSSFCLESPQLTWTGAHLWQGYA